MAQVAAAARTGTGRLNLYAGIHKALRAFMANTLITVGRVLPIRLPTARMTLGVRSASQLLTITDTPFWIMAT